MSAADPRLEDAARRVAAEPAPIDQISVYLTASEVFGEPFAQTSMQIIAENSTGRSVSAVCGHLLHLAHDNVRAVEQVLVKEVFHGDILTRVENLLRDEGRFLIAPQLMLLASAMAILYLPWDPGDPANAAALDANGFKTATLLALHAGDLATSDSTEREREEPVSGNMPASLALEIVANQLFNSTTSLPGDIARHERIWHGLAREAVNDPGLIDIAQAFEEAIGIPIDVFEAIGLGLYAARQSHGARIPMSWFDTTSITDEQLQAVLKITAYDVDELRERLRRDIGSDFSTSRWNLDAFSERPILRLPDAHLLIHSPQHLIERFFSGLAFWDVWFSASRRNRDRIKATWGKVTERYGQEVLDSMAPTSGDTKRVWSETELQEAYARPGRKIADAVVEYGDTWIVIDFSSRRPPRELAHAESEQALDNELRSLVLEKAAQLDSTIEALRNDEGALTRHPRIHGRRFIAVIVIHSKWPVNPVTTELARNRIKDQGHLGEPYVEPLQIMTVEELEMVESIQESGGPDFATILRAKEAGPLFRMGLKDHVLRVEKLHVGTSRRATELYRSAFDRIIDTFGFDSAQINK